LSGFQTAALRAEELHSRGFQRSVIARCVKCSRRIAGQKVEFRKIIG
jgi:hypothetical protein